jgi:putative ABC transport system permease protein
LPRFFVALCGIVFAVTLLTVQVALFTGFSNSTTLPISESSADVWVSAPEMLYFEGTLPLQYSDVAKVRAVPGVQRAEALSLTVARWRGPHDLLALGRVIGFDPNGTLFDPDGVDRSTLARLRAPYAFAIDATQMRILDLQRTGQSGVIGTLPAHFAYVTHGTQPIVSATFFYTSLETANAYTPSALSFFAPPGAAPPPLEGSDPIMYVLVKARNPAASAQLAAAIERRVSHVRAMTRDAMIAMTRDYWVNRTGIGFVLTLIALMGAFVGIVVVGQILYTSINEHFREYGTLKAIGVNDSYLYGVIALQASFMALIAYFPSLALTFGIRAISAGRGVDILITPGGALLVLVVALAICNGAGTIAMQRVTRADPALVFRA